MSLNDLPKVNPAPAGNEQSSDQVLADQSTAQQVPSLPIDSSNLSVPSEAADTDLIEKEWVERAKQIVEHTKDDPREQQKALSRMKADYMKKRYNKDIKVSNE